MGIMKRLFKLLIKGAVITVGLWILLSFTVFLILLINGNKNQSTVAQTVPACQPNASQLLSFINQERAKVGSPALSIDNSLVISAHNKLNDEVTRQYYGHNLIDGSNDVSFMREQGINAASSEDLNANDLNPTIDWNTFKHSPAHYASLTNPQYTRVGIAEQCVNYVIARETDTSDNAPVGTHISELTVVHLAAQ